MRSTSITLFRECNARCSPVMYETVERRCAAAGIWISFQMSVAREPPALMTATSTRGRGTGNRNKKRRYRGMIVGLS